LVSKISTSFSTPIVSGLAALLVSRNPALSPEEVMNIIKTNVDPYDSEYNLGTGRINAYKALNASNNPPEKPDPPTGETSCKTGEEYIYYASTTDPEGDDIFYLFDWGNGGTSFIMGPYESGTEGNASNVWFEKEEYEVKVQAIDEFGAESEWSDPLLVSMPKIKVKNPFFLNFLENHPHLFPLLRQILGLN
jgi:subtilisin family serine protease